MFTRIRKFLNDHVATSLVLFFMLCGVAFSTLTSHTETLLDTLLLAIDSDADGAISDEAWYTGFVDTSGTPVADDIAQFTDANTVKGMTYTELCAIGAFEAAIEAVIDLSDLQGAVTDAQVPNTITIDLATLATTLTITDNESTDENNAILFTAGGDLDGGNLGIESDGDIYYNPSSGTLTAPLFAGDGSNLTNVGADNEVYGSGWNADTSIPEKDDIYDYLHQADADDDGDWFDAAKPISGNLEVQDNINFSHGNDDDISMVWITADAAQGIAASYMWRDLSDNAVMWLIPGSNSLGIAGVAAPENSFRDSDSGTNDINLVDKYDDMYAGGMGGNFTTVTEDSEVSDITIYAMLAGSKTDVLHFDGSDERWETAYQIQHYDVTTEVVPIGYMTDGASAPDALATLTSGTDKVDARTFAGDADEDLQFTWEIPADLDTTSGIKFRVICFVSSATGPSAETWQFELQGFSLGDGDALDGTNGTAQTSNSGSRTDAQYDRVSTAWSSAMTSTHITGLAVGETASFKLYRDVDDTDTYVQNVAVSAIEFKYKRKHDITF